MHIIPHRAYLSTKSINFLTTRPVLAHVHTVQLVQCNEHGLGFRKLSSYYPPDLVEVIHLLRTCIFHPQA